MKNLKDFIYYLFSNIKFWTFDIKFFGFNIYFIKNLIFIYNTIL